MTTEFQWIKRKIAEDELSTVWHSSAVIETSEQARLAAEEASKDGFWPVIREMAEKAEELLRAEGLPGGAECIEHDGAGKWWHVPVDDSESRKFGERKFCLGYVFIRRNFPDLSDIWYASELSFHCRMAIFEFGEDSKHNPKLLELIFRISELRTEWFWRKSFKKEILRGKQVKVNAGTGGRVRASATAKQTDQILSEMLRHIRNGKSVARAAALVSKAGIGASSEANRKIWNRHGEKVGTVPAKVPD